MDRGQSRQDRHDLIDPMEKRILFTGGASLLAVNWALAIRNRWRVVTGLHNRAVSLADVDTKRIDIESPDAFARILDAGPFDVVVHAAGLTSIEACDADPERAWHDNVTLAANVAAACAATGTPLVHVSTDHLFSGEEPRVGEDCPPAPRNTYGKTKAEAERQVLKLNAGALVVRTNFYGWGPSYRRSFSDGILDALRSGSEVTLFQDVFFTPILIEALADTVHELVARGAAGIFHVVGDDRMSKYEFGLRIARAFDLSDAPIRAGLLANQPSLSIRPFDMSLSNDKVSQLLGRRIGGADAHFARLRQQEIDGFAQELRQL